MRRRYTAIAAILALTMAMAGTQAVYAAQTYEATQLSKADIESEVAKIRSVYQLTNSGAYTQIGNQWFSAPDAYGTQHVVKTVLSNGTTGLDELMQAYGYTTYSLEYYYFNPNAADYVGGLGAAFIFGVIDGREYRYYYQSDDLIRRIGPDGAVQNNPMPNAFLEGLAEAGIVYGEDQRDAFTKDLNNNVIAFSSNYFATDAKVLLYARQFDTEDWDNQPCGMLIVDANTRVGDKVKQEPTWHAGDNASTWMNRFLHTDPGIEVGYSGGLDCLQVSTKGNHVEYIEGIYATH